MKQPAITYARAGNEDDSSHPAPRSPLLNDPAFLALVRGRRTFAWTLTILMLALYFGYILTLAFNPALLGRPLATGEPMTVGIPVGFGMLAMTFLMVAAYVYRANTVYDRAIRLIRKGAYK